MRRVERYLARHGRPIRYGHVAERPGRSSAYQTVFAREPGSAEMPSAGRPFTAELVAELVGAAASTSRRSRSTPACPRSRRGEPPYPERYRVPAETARLVNAVRGGAAGSSPSGTTVVRALETVADATGRARRRGLDELVVTPERGVRAVDGLLTGWHEPESSHLQLLEAVAGPRAAQRSYDAARGARLRWHEFGDIHLILP